MFLWRFTSWLLLCFAAGAAYAATERAITESAATEQVAARLVASVDSVAPGSEIYLGVNQVIIPHWHTYWSNPGDSGIATTIAWTLPAGASAGEILWPIPSRLTLGSITNYGYSDQVTLLSKIRIPENALPGSHFVAAATVDWLVCEKECIPQQVQLSLSLPVVHVGAPTGNGSELVQQALQQLPVSSPWPVEVQSTQHGFTLNIGHTQMPANQLKDIWFYPAEWGVIAQNEQQPFALSADGISLDIKAGEVLLKPGQALKGVLVIQQQTAQGVLATGFSIEQIPTLLTANAHAATHADAAISASPVDNSSAAVGFASALLLALIGGVILNLMPCVFPVLSLKALSLVSHAQQSSGHIRLHGWVYTAGVLASFGLLAGVLIILKAGGAQIGWGFQFQSPVFVLAMAYLMFLVGLNLSGVFVIGGNIAGVGSSLADRGGYSGSFFTGVLATIVATPCTAPFMAAALGYALAQPALKLFAIFLSLGFGLALPYLLLASWPRLHKWLPRPGAWMERMKQILAFPMYAAAVWLVWVLAQQAGAGAVLIALAGMVALAFAAWLYDVTRNNRPRTEKLGTGFALSICIATFAIACSAINLSTDAHAERDQTVAKQSKSQNWEPYSAQRLQALLAEGKPVFLNFTASWCISCLVNERVALSDSAVKDAFKTAGITYLKGDWTKRDAEITKILTQFGRSGVPLYVFYPAGQNQPPVELPQILTPDIVLEQIAQNAPNKVVSQ